MTTPIIAQSNAALPHKPAVMESSVVFGTHYPEKMRIEFNEGRDLSDSDTLLRDVLAWADELDISHVSVENIRTYLSGKDGAK